MRLYYEIVSFIFGIVLGSFYNVVGYRLPREQSIVKPSSHCTKCNHKLGVLELIPVISYIFLGGKCKKCGDKISCFYPIFEFTTGVLFALSYHIFGSSINFLIAITFISMLLIIIISDYQTMIIPDEVLIFFSSLLIIELIIKDGVGDIVYHLLDALIAFAIMFVIKLLGDFIFKKESMGGGDIKLLAVIGLVLNYKMAVISIFLASFIGLPISLISMYKTKSDIIPFGPFLSVSSIILILTQFNIDKLIALLTI